jgi:NADP-dependent 3-hydroxy acid dehydrogenase YdfG
MPKPDVTHHGQTNKAVFQAEARFDGINVLVNNAGDAATKTNTAATAFAKEHLEQNRTVRMFAVAGRAKQPVGT